MTVKGNPMKRKSMLNVALSGAVLIGLGAAAALHAADTPRGSHLQSPNMPPELVKKTEEETVKAIKRGEALWHDRSLGSNGLNCNMCHADAAVTHPETYPKYKQQFDRVVTVGEFMNWCIIVALHGKRRELGSEDLVALEAYQAARNRGQVMEIGVPAP